MCVVQIAIGFESADHFAGGEPQRGGDSSGTSEQSVKKAIASSTGTSCTATSREYARCPKSWDASPPSACSAGGWTARSNSATSAKAAGAAIHGATCRTACLSTVRTAPGSRAVVVPWSA